ncbi:MAG TPA: hypothetical protein PKV35_09640, partial [bacterium]|nr:hypothetical protein [bacterium]
MKKCLVLLMMLSAGFFSCSSKTSTGSDSDNFISDKDPLSENENSDNETDDKSGHVNDDVVLDDDSSSVSDNESDDEDTQDHICDPNPCETEKNIAENRTRCMPADEGRSYTCECDVSYHSSEGLCCQPYSN